MALEYLIHLARLGAADIHPGGRQASVAMLRALDIRPGQRLLEFGCGTAGTLQRVGLRGPRHAVGLDLLPQMLKQAQRRVRGAGMDGRVSLVQGSALRIPFAAEVFDAVFCESVLGFQRTPVLRAMLAEIRRVLRPGGRFVANEGIWKAAVDDATARAVNTACQRDFGMRQATESAWHVDDWQRELGAAGFEVRSCERLGPPAAATPARWPDRLRRWLPASEIPGTLAGRISPRSLWERLHYRRLLASYRPLSVHVEGRLFVAVRPAAEG
jgi:SAM-dependent methyltransferase